jgi:hypothetical protein
MLDKSKESSDRKTLFDFTSMHYIILMKRKEENRRDETRIYEKRRD